LEKKVYMGVGRRKESVAIVRIKDGVGKIVINGKNIDEYFKRESYLRTIKLPLSLTSTENSFDITIKAVGGGTTGQTDAIKLALSRALVQANPKWRTILKKEGLLKRDPRKVERKKYGQPKARKRFQFSKR